MHLTNAGLWTSKTYNCFLSKLPRVQSEFFSKGLLHISEGWNIAQVQSWTLKEFLLFIAQLYIRSAVFIKEQNMDFVSIRKLLEKVHYTEKRKWTREADRDC